MSADRSARFSVLGDQKEAVSASVASVSTTEDVTLTEVDQSDDIIEHARVKSGDKIEDLQSTKSAVTTKTGEFPEDDEDYEDLSDESEEEEGEKKKPRKKRKHRKKGIQTGEKVGAEFTPLGPVVSSLLGGSDEDEEEAISDEEEEKEEVFEPIDREAYVEEYKNLLIQQRTIKQKSSFLQYKLIQFYKKRKMDHVYEHEDVDEDAFDRYHRRLDELGVLRERGHREQAAELADIQFMGELVKEQTEQSKKDFKSMQMKEKDTARGLIDTRTGKPISDKQVERLITRQASRSEEIGAIRLNYIKKKEQVKSLEQHIRTLETIDGKHHLIEYEQLRMENQNFNDKIEERDEELQKLRDRYYKLVQGLAHVREKACVIDKNIDDLTLELESVKQDVSESRENINTYKVKRDENRTETLKIKEQSGLLPHTKLLIDMEECIKEVEKLRTELHSTKEEYKERKNKLFFIRKNIEHYQTEGAEEVQVINERKKIMKQPKKQNETTTHVPKVYKGRPSLLLPRLSSASFYKKKFQTSF